MRRASTARPATAATRTASASSGATRRRRREIGGRDRLVADPKAYFNRLTLTGIDKFPDYTVDGQVYTALQYLQFVNPGDLRVVRDGEGCGTPGCHDAEQATWVPRHAFGNSTGIYSGTTYAAGIQNVIPEHRGLWEDTAADYGFRAVVDPDWEGADDEVGTVGSLVEWPERAVYGDESGIYRNPLYDSDNLDDDVYTAADGPDMVNRIRGGSPLEHVYFEAINLQCGDCHLGSAGANNRYGDFRSSGCTSCHMEYSPDGRSRSSDPNVNHYEPANPDAIAAPERPHRLAPDPQRREVPARRRVRARHQRLRVRRLPSGLEPHRASSSGGSGWTRTRTW